MIYAHIGCNWHKWKYEKGPQPTMIGFQPVEALKGTGFASQKII